MEYMINRALTLFPNAKIGVIIPHRGSNTTIAAYKDISDRVKGKKTKPLDILIVVNMFLMGFDSKPLSVLYEDKELAYHDLLQAYSRTNRVEKETKPWGIIVCYRILKQRTDEALALFSQGHAEDIVTKAFEFYVQKFNEITAQIRQIALVPEEIDLLQSEDEQKAFVILFRELSRYMLTLKTFVEFNIDHSGLDMTDQEFQDYKSKYLMLYRFPHIIMLEVVFMTNNTQYKTLVNHWLKSKQPMITASTHANFVVIAENHLIPYFGKRKIGGI